MNPLVWKIGAPAAIVLAVALMRWFNTKKTGEPFFPGVEDSKQGSRGSGNIGFFGKDPKLTSGDDVIDPGNYSSGDYPGEPDGGGGTRDSNPDVPFAQPGAGHTSSLAGAVAGHAGVDVGGYSNIPVALTSGGDITSITSAQPQYVPYSPTPTTTPVINQFGGSGGGTFAI